MTRPAQVVINLAALRHNLSRVRQLAPDSKVMAVVKADAYGHGLARVATTLSDADSFGVACLEEAEEIREARIEKPIVLLEGPYASGEIARIEKLGLEMIAHHEEQLLMLEKSRVRTPLRVWLKLDSGMHRLGFPLASVKDVYNRLVVCGSVDNDIRLMTHLAVAGDRNHPMTKKQIVDFDRACHDLKGERSIANSAGILSWPDSHKDYVRPGLMLYGVSPLDDGTATDHGLQPVMTLQSRLISVKHIRKGETVGYGASWTCPEDGLIGVIATGYGDGFPRHARSGTPVLVNGIRCQLIGYPSMDMLTVDLRNCVNARVGDAVEMWGTKLAVEEVAKHANTVPYELLCGVHKRLQFIEHG